MMSIAGMSAPPSRVTARVCGFTIGCSRVGSLLNPTPLSEIRRVLRAAADAGISSFDTANIYGQGDSERELGKVFGGRSDVFITTKGGYAFSPAARAAKYLKPAVRLMKNVPGLHGKVRSARHAAVGQDFSAAALTASLEGSLRRLRRETIDGYLLHDPSVTSLVEGVPWSTLSAAKKAGKIRYIGVSIESDDCLVAASALPDCDIVQAPLDLFVRMRNSAAYQKLVDAGAAIFVREILSSRAAGYCEGQPLSLAGPLAVARSLPGVTSVMVGVSTMDHLRALLAAA